MALILQALSSCDLREMCSKVWLTGRFAAMRYAVTTMLFTALLLGLGSVVQPSPAIAETYDGNWTVLVITDKGTCDRGYRYAVRVADGQVRYNGEKSVDISGTVSPRGEVHVSISFKGQSASGAGRLFSDTGNGSWQGAGSKGVCSGRWEAERR